MNDLTESEARNLGCETANANRILAVMDPTNCDLEIAVLKVSQLVTCLVRPLELRHQTTTSAMYKKVTFEGYQDINEDWYTMPQAHVLSWARELKIVIEAKCFNGVALDRISS